jgi:hypothetical protein
MLQPDDLIPLPYTSDLTEAGIAYACRSLAYTYNRMNATRFERLRRIVAGVASELALRRWLLAQGIPFDTFGQTDFTRPDHYDIGLAGRRCDLKTFVFTDPRQIRVLQRQPWQLLQAEALVPLDQHRAHPHAQDIYLFAFVYARMARNRHELRRVMKTSQPLYWIHPLPPPWSKPPFWAPLSPLILKSEQESPLRLELGGQDGNGAFHSQRLELPPRTRYVLEAPFFSLLYIHAEKRPLARLGIRSARFEELYLIHPKDWGNIWVYGQEIHLAGWITWEEFNAKGRVLPAGSAVFQYRRTRTTNLALPLTRLHPLAELLERIRSEKGKNE